MRHKEHVASVIAEIHLPPVIRRWTDEPPISISRDRRSATCSPRLTPRLLSVDKSRDRLIRLKCISSSMIVMEYYIELFFTSVNWLRSWSARFESLKRVSGMHDAHCPSSRR